MAADELQTTVINEEISKSFEHNHDQERLLGWNKGLNGALLLPAQKLK